MLEMGKPKKKIKNTHYDIYFVSCSTPPKTHSCFTGRPCRFPGFRLAAKVWSIETMWLGPPIAAVFCINSEVHICTKSTITFKCTYANIPIQNNFRLKASIEK